MNNALISHFTPSLMPAETLEALFVQREDLAQRLVDLVRDSVLTKAKHHVLLVGPRGIGKTHLLSLVYHRLKRADDLKDRFRIAWLREEEWGVASFLDLLMRVFRALDAERPDPSLAARVEALRDLAPDAAEHAAAKLLKESVGNMPLLILAENLEDIFHGLGEQGQARLRGYIQNNPFISIVASSPALFGGVSLQTSPFYGFFQIESLGGLTFEEAVNLIAKIAACRQDAQLAELVNSPTGRARVRAVEAFAHGNHRVYVIFSQFLNCDSLNELVEPFMKTLDELTPYYQSRLQLLSPQQRKIVELLCDAGYAVPVKAIARSSFMTQQTAASQLKILREYGYVEAHALGRESYYELREPLMRLCVEVKKNRGEPIRLLVLMLRLWYPRQHLQQRLAGLSPDAVLDRQYLESAIHLYDTETTNPLVEASRVEFQKFWEAGQHAAALRVVDELLAAMGIAGEFPTRMFDLIAKGQWAMALALLSQPREGMLEYLRHVFRAMLLHQLERLPDALAAWDAAIAIGDRVASVWQERAKVLIRLKRPQEALESCERAVGLEPDAASVWALRADALSDLNQTNDALESLGKAINLDPRNPDYRIARARLLAFAVNRPADALADLAVAARAGGDEVLLWSLRGFIHVSLRDYTEALACFDRIPNKLSTLGIIEEWKGRALLALERYAEAGTYLENSVKARPNDAELWHNLARARYMLGDYAAAEVALMKALAVHGDTPKLLGFLAACQLALSKPQKALDASDRGLSLEPADLMCMRCRGSALGVLGRYAEAVTAFDRLLGLAPDDDSTHFLRALSLANLGRLPEALASIEKAIALADSETRYRLLRAELTLAVHGWDAALAALYEALCRAGADDNARLASSFAKLLAFAFNDTAPRDVLRTRLSGLLVAATTVRPLPDVKQSPELPAALATALIRHIPAVLSDQIGDAKASLWLDTWKEVAGARPEFAIALRILGAAVLCRDLTKRPRAKLELPKEERQILVELLNEAFPPPA